MKMKMEMVVVAVDGEIGMTLLNLVGWPAQGRIGDALA